MRRGFAAADPVLAPLALFVSFYLATFLTLAWTGWLHPQWVAALSVINATAGIIVFWERGRWPIGLLAPPRAALRELAVGALFASVIVIAADSIIRITTDVRRGPGIGFPWLELIGIFIPAVVHEELLFRGYAFQKLRRWHRLAAIVITSAIFTVLHLRNTGVTALALTNIFLGGVLLALAYERHQRLLFPLASHLTWNVLSGPVLGWEVSGYVPAMSLLTTDALGPELLTGGAFGIEGSVWMTVAEMAGIGWLWKTNSEFRDQNSEFRTV